MSYYLKVFLFVLINFGALGLGSWLMGGEVTGTWYQGLNKAPWTPPGWVFGAAWTTIMLCFSVYMAKLVEQKELVLNTVLGLFAIQWILNVTWNYVFFNQHLVLFGLIEITSLLVLVGYFLFGFWKYQKNYSLLILPYFVWLAIATSLNAYVLFNN